MMHVKSLEKVRLLMLLALYISSTSWLTSWNFFQSFFSFLVFCSASSARFPYLEVNRG